MLIIFIFLASSAIICTWNPTEYVMLVTSDSTVQTTLHSYDLENIDMIRKLLIKSSNIKTLGSSLMENKKKLREVKIHSSLTTINSYCFSGCSSLEIINLPASLVNIYSNSFDSCTNLKKLIFPSKIGIIGKDSIKNSGIESIIALAADSVVGKNIDDASLGNTNKLAQFIYCGKTEWKGTVKKAFQNSTIEEKLPTVPLDYSDSTFLTYNVNKVDVTTECSEAQQTLNVEINWDTEYQHGYPDPEIIPTSEETFSSQIESFTKIESSLIVFDSSIENKVSSIIQEETINEHSKIQDGISEAESIAKSIEIQTDEVFSDSAKPEQSFIFDSHEFSSLQKEVSKSSFYEDDLSDISIFETSKRESIINTDEDLDTSFFNTFTHTPIIEESIIFKPEISTLIVQNIKAVTQRDIIDKLGSDINKKVWKLLIKGVEDLGDSFMESSYVKEVLMDDTVKSIGKKCFYDCQSLVRLRLSNGLDKIDDKAFAKCTKLKSLIFPNNISYLGQYLIEGSGLINATMLNTTIKTEVDLYVFAGARSLSDFHYCGDTYYNPRSSIYAFKDSMITPVTCPLTYSVIVAGGYYFLKQAAQVKDITEHCRNIENEQYASIDWEYESSHGEAPYPTPTVSATPKPTPRPTPFPTQTYTEDEYPVKFNYSSSVLVFQNKKMITKENFAQYGNDYQYIIKNAEKLVVKPGVLELDSYLMEGSVTLETVILADSVETIGYNCFSNCKMLQKIRLSKNLKKIGKSAFENTTNLKEIVFPSKILYLGEELIKGSAVTTATMLNTIIKPKNVDDYVFAYAPYLEAFYYCGDEYLYRPTYSIHAFAESNVLGNGDISVPLSYSNLYHPYIEDTFLGWTVQKKSITDTCNQAVKYLDEPIDWDLEINGWIKKGFIRFNKDNGMVETNLSIVSSTNIDELLNGTGRDKIRILRLEDGVETLGYECMKNCSELIEVQMSNTLVSIIDNCFMNCVKLSSIVLPKSIFSIGDRAFSNCHSLKKIIIPGNIDKIGFQIFENSGIQEIMLLTPTDVKQSISLFAFYGIPDIKSLIYCGLEYPKYHDDRYIDSKILASVDYLYRSDDFLGRTITRGDFRQKCVDEGDTNIDPFSSFNPLIFSTVISVIFALALIITFFLLFVILRKKAGYYLIEQRKKSDSSELISIDEDSNEEI